MPPQRKLVLYVDSAGVTHGAYCPPPSDLIASKCSPAEYLPLLAVDEQRVGTAEDLFRPSAKHRHQARLRVRPFRATPQLQNAYTESHKSGRSRSDTIDAGEKWTPCHDVSLRADVRFRHHGHLLNRSPKTCCSVR